MSWFNPFKKSPTLREFFHERYRPQRLLGKSHKTELAYFVTFDRLALFLGKPPRLSDLNDETLAAFAEWRRDVTQVKAATVARDMVCIKAIWRFARDVGLLRLGPTVKTMPFVTPPPVSYTEEQLNTIFAAIQTEPQPVLIAPKVYVPGPVWWTAVYLTFWDSAERFSALFDLKEADLDLEGGSVHFRAETRKGGMEDNLQPIEPRTVEAIEKLLSHYANRRGDYAVFRWAANRNTIFGRWGRILDRAGVPNQPRKKFHLLRSSRATHEHILGGDATAKLTHKSNVTTRKHYLDKKLIAKYMRRLNIFQPGDSAELIAVKPLLLTHDGD
jgi:integrase